MSRFFLVFLIVSFSLIYSPAYSKPLTYEEGTLKMKGFVAQKNYKKALDVGLKLKESEITDKEKEELKERMEGLLIIKEFDDILKSHTMHFDKYENKYIYNPLVFYPYEALPHIYATKTDTLLKLEFSVSYKSRERLEPNRIILHSDGLNITFEPFAVEDTLISRDTWLRRCTAWVNVPQDKVDKLAFAMRGTDVSFKLASNSDYEIITVTPSNREVITKGIWVYNLLKDKKMELGQTRF